MRYVNLFLKDEQVIELKAISAESGAPVSELIRRAIDKYLNERKEKESKEKEKSNE